MQIFQAGQEAIAIATNGLPVPMVVPDPRAYLLHKAWLSRQVDREPVKKQRDIEQAAMIAELRQSYLPQFPLEARYLRYLPKEMIRQASQTIEDTSAIRLPGLDF